MIHDLSYISQIRSIAELDEYSKRINEEIAKVRKTLVKEEKADRLLTKSFGYIKEAFENFAPALFKSKEGKKLIADYTNTVKRNKNMSTLHNVYEGIRKTNKNSDIDFFINSITNEMVKVDGKDLSESLNHLRQSLRKAYMIIGDEAESLLPENRELLDKSVEYITENKKTIKNLPKYSAAVKAIREAIERNENANPFEEKDIDEIAAELMRGYNEKYREQLSDEEKAVVREVAESTVPSEVFAKYKNICETNLSKSRAKFEKESDTESVKKINSILEQVSKKIYSVETAGDDICKLIEISKIFE